MSCKFKSLKVQYRGEVPQSISSEATLTCSMSSIKGDVAVNDSGLDINEMQGLKEENQELKLQNAKLKYELLTMEKKIDNQRATIEQREEELQESRQKWMMFEDHSSLLALHANEVSESKELLVGALEMTEKQLDDMTVKNSEMMKKMEEKHSKERSHNAVQIKELEEAAAALEAENAELKKQLQKRDLYNQAKEVVSAAICKSMDENFNEELGECLKKNKILEDEVALLKTQILHQESQMAESYSLLAESKEKCKAYDEKVSLLTCQLEDATKASGILENELALKKREIDDMEARHTEEIKQLANENQEKVEKELLKYESLEQEIARYSVNQAELEEKVKEQNIILKSKQVTFDAIIGGMATTCKREAAKYHEEVHEMKMKLKEEDERYNSLLDKASILDLKLLKTKRELIDLKDQYYTKAKELKCENSKAHAKLLSEQAENTRTLSCLKSKLQCFMERCSKLEEARKEMEANSGRLQLELDGKDKEIKHLYEQLTLSYEKLNSKDIAIEQLSTKKPKRRGLRRLLCC